MHHIYFSSIVLNGFYLRIIFVFISIFISIKIIGLENIKFLKSYLHRGLFSPKHLFYWFITFISLWYFQSLIRQDHTNTIEIVFEKEYFLAWLTVLLLIGVIIHAFLDMLKSTFVAQKTKKEIEKAQLLKNASTIGSFASFFLPAGILIKVAVLGGSWWLNNHIDNKVSETLTSNIRKNIKSMLIIISINLLIILLSVYLIRGEIIFW